MLDRLFGAFHGLFSPVIVVPHTHVLLTLQGWDAEGSSMFPGIFFKAWRVECTRLRIWKLVIEVWLGCLVSGSLTSSI